MTRFVCALAAALALSLSGPTARAQTATAPVSAAKKELVQKVLTLQQPGIESTARALAEQAVAPIAQQASVVLQSRVAPDRREAVGRELQADFKKFNDDVVPLLRERATKLAPASVGALLEERFTEDELKQVIAILESPVNRKFQQLGGDMQRALTEKLVAETRSIVEPKMAVLQDNVAKRLGLQTTSAAPPRPASGAVAKPAAAASR